MAKKLFQKGEVHGKGGAREGAGRKPDWLKDYCAELVSERKIVDFLAQVTMGDSYEMRDRIKCAEILLERGYGKPAQTLEHKGKIEQGLAEGDKDFIRDSIKEFMCKQ